ncbi:GSCOCG00007796001-RA-CDS [Cotesia congregata]|nr:GSCOCG00007796001-RA-CDS [Cotesia congregata]
MSKLTKPLYTFKPFVLKEHTPKDDEEPEGRCGSEIYCKGHNLYVYGGRDPTVVDFRELGNDEVYIVTKPEFRDMWVFNLLSNEWAYINNGHQLPDRKHNEIGVIFEGNLLTICTMRVPYSDKLTYLYICNILNGYVINQPLQGEVPKYPLSNNMIRDGGYYYLVGDVNDENNRVGNVYRINMKSGIWECVYKCQGKYKNELWKCIPYYLVFDGKTIFTFFSLDDDDDDERDDNFTPYSFLNLAAFNIQNRRWRMINTHGDVDHVPNYPMDRDELNGSDPRITHYRDTNNNFIVILSGQIDHEDYYNDLWELNLSTMTWKNIDNRGTLIPPTFEDYSMTVSPAGQLFTFGGSIGDPKDRVPYGSRVHSVWITIPKLSDICWESVLHYLPSLVSMSQEQVENLGISWKFFQSRVN